MTPAQKCWSYRNRQFLHRLSPTMPLLQYLSGPMDGASHHLEALLVAHSDRNPVAPCIIGIVLFHVLDSSPERKDLRQQMVLCGGLVSHDFVVSELRKLHVPDMDIAADVDTTLGFSQRSELAVNRVNIKPKIFGLLDKDN